MGKRLTQSLFVQGPAWLPLSVMSALDEDNGIAVQGFFQAIAIQCSLIETDHDKANPAALPFDQSIGGQGRRQGHKANFVRTCIFL